MEIPFRRLEGVLRKSPEKPGRIAEGAERVRYRTLGNSELNVSVIGFGASPLGDVFGTIDPSEGERAVHKAIDNGINFFDVSPYYGLTLAETRLGTALEGKRKDIILATKCGRDGVETFDFSARRVNDSIDESLKRLRTDYVDLFQAHDVEFGDVEQIIHETIPAMRRVQTQGKARFIGITGYGLKTLIKIAEAIPLDSVLTYCRYDLLNDQMDEMLMPIAKRLGIGVLNASPLHMGILTRGGPPDWHPAPQSVRDAGRRAAEYCNQHGVDLTELALRYCFDHPLVASTLVGMSTRQHVSKNLQAITVPTDRALLEQVRLILAPVFNYVWTSGRTENHD
jgi:L-galactose dehydrogenase